MMSAMWKVLVVAVAGLVALSKMDLPFLTAAVDAVLQGALVVTVTVAVCVVAGIVLGRLVVDGSVMPRGR